MKENTPLPSLDTGGCCRTISEFSPKATVLSCTGGSFDFNAEAGKDTSVGNLLQEAEDRGVIPLVESDRAKTLVAEAPQRRRSSDGKVTALSLVDAFVSEEVESPEPAGQGNDPDEEASAFASPNTLDADPDFARVRAFEPGFLPLERPISRDRAFQLMAVNVHAQLSREQGRHVHVGPEQVNGLMKGAAIQLGCQLNRDLRWMMELQPDDRSNVRLAVEYVILRYGADVFFYFTSKSPELVLPTLDCVMIDNMRYAVGKR